MALWTQIQRDQNMYNKSLNGDTNSLDPLIYFIKE